MTHLNEIQKILVKQFLYEKMSYNSMEHVTLQSYSFKILL